MTGEGVGTIIMRTGEGQMTSGVTRTEEDPAVTGRTGEGAETTLREESHQAADTRPHPMVEDTDDPGADQQSVFIKTTLFANYFVMVFFSRERGPFSRDPVIRDLLAITLL